MPYMPYVHCQSCRITIHRHRADDGLDTCPRCGAQLRNSPRRLFGRLPGLTLTPVGAGGARSGGRAISRR
jgi:predicted nucleic acid-binding Zn ribbon protein